MIVWFTGNSGAGKSTLAKAIMLHYQSSVWLDGDALRQAIGQHLGFSKEDRLLNNENAARLARMLSEQGHLVIVSVIAPFSEIRTRITELCDPVWVYVKRLPPMFPERPYQPPEEVFTVENDWNLGDTLDAEQLQLAADRTLGYLRKQADTRGFRLL